MSFAKRVKLNRKIQQTIYHYEAGINKLQNQLDYSNKVTKAMNNVSGARYDKMKNARTKSIKNAIAISSHNKVLSSLLSNLKNDLTFQKSIESTKSYNPTINQMSDPELEK